MSALKKQSHANGVSGLIALLSGAHFSHHVLTALLVPLLPFIRNEFELTYAQTGIVTSAFTIAYGVAQLPAGWLSDKVGPRYLLLVGITGVAVAGAVIGLSPIFPMLLLGLVLMGIAGGGYHPAASAVISRVVQHDRRGQALGVHIIGGSASHFLAPIIAAGLVTAVGWRGSFLTLSAPVGILGVALFVLIHRRIQKTVTLETIAPAASSDSDPEPAEIAPAGTAPAGTAPAGTAPAAPAMTRLAVARMVFFLIIAGTVGASIATLIPFIPLYLADIRSIDQRLAASFIAVLYAAGFFAAPMGGWLSDRFGRQRVMVITGLLMGPAIALIIVTPFPAAMAGLLLILGILMFTKMPTAEAHIASEISERHRTTVLGVYFFSSMEGSAIFTPLLGAAIDRWGFTVGIVGLGAMLLAVSLICGTTLVVLNRVSMAQAAATPG
jgi:MFS transporter, FSR family, fosmidomycin resistance protein